MYNMRMKRIAVISYHTCPLSDEKDAEIGGMNTYVLELSKALAEKGYSIDIYTRCVDKNTCHQVQVQPNLRVLHIIVGEPVEIPKKQLFRHLPEFIRNTNKFIATEKLSYQLISAHYYLSGGVGLAIKKKLKIPLIVTFHTLGLMKNLVARDDDEREDLRRIKAELLLVKKADKVIATSDNDIEYLHTLYACPLDKVVLLSPGVNLRLFRPIDKSAAKKITRADINRKIILFVGRIAPLKGIDVLLYAIRILTQKHPNILLCLWIVGEWSKEFRRLQYIRKLLDISAYVKFVGQKQQTELPYYYNCAEVVVMPSYYESFGIVALEAMACGVPVIVSDVTGVSHLLDKEHNDLLISTASPISLAKKINNLLTNKTRHKMLSEKVYNRVQNLSWDNAADKFIQIWQALKVSS